MNMFEKIGEFQPDSLIASINFPVLNGGIKLKSGQGLLKRGSLILNATDGGYIAGSTATTGEDVSGTVFGILSDDVDTGEDANETKIPSTCYITGIFNPDAIIIAGDTKKITDFEDEMRIRSLFLQTVQEYDKGE